jgi:phosphopantothenoylcysteine decarboxylase/phosphopantothenate--cysteine ligase
MYEDCIFGDRLSYLKEKGVIEIPPIEGRLACGEHGIGKMASSDTIINAVLKAMTPSDLKGKKILISAGPTVEPIDPARFISNRSSGKMGIALAKAAYLRGADVTLVCGHTSISIFEGIRVIKVQTADQMKQAIVENCAVDILIMAAAPADYRPKNYSQLKMPKGESLTLELIKNDDIIKTITSRNPCPFVVGFSAQTGNRIDIAREKLSKKSMDMIVFNDITIPGAGFDCNTNVITIIDSKGEYPLPLMKKEEAACKIIDKIIENI